MAVKAKSSKKTEQRFAVKCGKTVSDGVFDISSFEKFLNDRIKINGKVGKLGESIRVERDSKSSEIAVVSSIAFSKRYLKYLTKKFLKKQQLRDYIRVISNTKDSYELRYFNVNEEEEE